MKWVDVSIDIPAANQVETLIERLQDGVELYEGVVDGVNLLLRAVAVLQSFQDVQSQAVAAALDVVEQNLPSEWFPDTATISTHVLGLPLLAAGGQRISQPRINAATVEGISLGSKIVKAPVGIIDSGGNYGVYRRIVESLFDRQDFDRPTLGPDCGFAAVVLVYGAATYIPAAKLAFALYGLFSEVIPVPPDLGRLPVPQNVKVRAAARPICESTSEEISVALTGQGETAAQVSWQQESTFRSIGRNIRIRVKVLSWHVYLKQGGRIQNGEDLSEYQVVQEDVESANELSNLPTEGNDFTLKIRNLERDEVYYISVAYTLEVTDLSTEDVAEITPTTATLSEQVRFAPSESDPPRSGYSGRPPDWVSVRQPLYSLPALREVYDRIDDALDTLRNSYATFDNEITAALDKSTQIIDTLKSAIFTIQDIVENVISALQDINSADPSAGMWATTFSGSGKAQFIDSLNEAFFDPNTENIPPFPLGTEATGAVVFVVEGPTPNAASLVLEPIAAILSTAVSGEASGIESVSAEAGEAVVRAADTVADSLGGNLATQSFKLSDLGLSDDDPCE